jgi:hypothetical protein
MRRSASPVRRTEPLRDDAFAAERAGVLGLNDKRGNSLRRRIAVISELFIRPKPAVRRRMDR